MKRSSLLFLTLICVASSVWSQTSGGALQKTELPSGPILRSMGNFARWEISFSYADELKKKDRSGRKPKKPALSPGIRLRNLVTTKTEQIVHEERTDVLRQKSEVWYDASSQYTRSNDASVWFRTTAGTAGGESSYQPLPAIGYRNVDVIKAENFVGTISHRGKNCLVFVPGGSKELHLGKAEDTQKKLNGVETIAYVDEESRRPTEVRTGSETRFFQYDTPPTKMQTLPADLVAQIKKGDEARSRLGQPAPRPY